ncbi:MAG: hypothetical protein U0822_16510 [Anaerolineae bacterium]
MKRLSILAAILIPMMAVLLASPSFRTAIIPPSASAASSFEETALAYADQQQVIQFNPGAALQKRIFADGFVPNSPEFSLQLGSPYIAQRAENLATGEVRVYYVHDGDWENVSFVVRGQERSDLDTALLAEAERRQVMRFNTEAALQKSIFADGFVPNSPEFYFRYDGGLYGGQRAENLTTGQVRVYWAVVDDWGSVRIVERGQSSPYPPPATLAKVVSFTASPTTTQRLGDTVTLQWQAVGDNVQLCPMYGDGLANGACETVPLTGHKTIEVTEGMLHYAGYALTVSAGGTKDAAYQNIAFGCRSFRDWFFTDPPAICPEATPTTRQGAYQAFEHGMMVWEKPTTADGSDEAYTIFLDEPAPPEDGRYATEYGKPTLKPAESPDNGVGETPPPGRYEPVGGFGLFWRGEVETNTVGFDNLRQRLGWALEPERAAEFKRQCQLNQTLTHMGYFVCYIGVPDGRVLQLHPDSTALVRYDWREWPGRAP